MGWNEKKYRREINRSKEQLTDKETFLSARYRELLRKMASQITEKGVSDVHTYADSASNCAGWCDGKRIGINIANGITNSFVQKELKNISLIGILGHECGHRNFSNNDLLGTYLSGISKEGRLYPCMPMAESAEEEENVKEMQEVLQNRNPYFIGVLHALARYVNNFLEDLYVEERMCREYPGSIRRGIQMNRRRWLEKKGTVKERKEAVKLETTALSELLMEFAVSGSINVWNGEDEDCLKCMEACRPYLEKIRSEDRAPYRFLLTNQILLKMWGFIQKDAEKLKEEEKKEKEEKGDDKKDDKKEEKNQEENESEGTPKEQDGNAQAEGIEQEAAAQNGTDDEAEWKDILERIAEIFQNSLPVYSPAPLPDDGEELLQDTSGMVWPADWQPEDGWMETDNANPPAESGQRESPMLSEEFLEAEQKLDTFLYLMAKKKTDDEYESSLYASMLNLLSQIEFGQTHREVEMKVFRSLQVPEEAILQYREMERQMRHVRKKLRERLLPILEKRRSRMESGLPIGRQLDVSHIYRPDGRIFQKRRNPGETPTAVIAYLIDQSYSMAESKRIQYAKVAALCLYQFGVDAGIPVCVYGHHTKLGENWQELVCLHSYAEFDSIDGQDKYRIMGMKPYGANRDGAALKFVGEMLLRRPEEQKLLILSSDGLPNASGYSGDTAKEDLKAVKQDLESQGVLFLAAAIGENKQEIQEIYGDAFLDISDIRKFPVKLTNEVLKRIG